MTKLKITSKTKIAPIPHGKGIVKYTGIFKFVRLLMTYWKANVENYHHCNAEINIDHQTFTIACYSSKFFFFRKKEKELTFRLSSLSNIYVFADEQDNILEEGTALVMGICEDDNEEDN